MRVDLAPIGVLSVVTMEPTIPEDQRVPMVLTAAKLPTISFSAITAGVTLIRGVDVTDLRAALVNAYYSIGLPIPTFGEQITAGSSLVKGFTFRNSAVWWSGSRAFS